MYKKIVSSSLLAGALLAMNGCGGGGSSPDTAVTSSKVSGVAVDDLILNGVVTATDTGGATLASGRTSSTDGTYLLNVPYAGVVLLNVVCDENSTMWDPSTDISTAETCGSETTLNSIADVEAGTEITVNITPLTEVVYQRAIELADDNISNINADDVDEARSDIGLMFSVDPLEEDPTDGEYAAIISAIDALATANDTTVVEITTDLAEALSDGEAEGEEIITDLVAEMEDENLTNNLTDTNGTYTPPDDAADLSDIDAAKALFTELRTQAMSVTDYTNSGTPGFLDTEAVDMEQALNGVVLDISFMEMALNLQLDIESAMRDANLTTSGPITIGSTRTLTLTLTGPSSYSYLVEQNNTTPWEGTVSYPYVEESDIYTFTTLTAQVDGTFPLGYELDPVPAGVENSQSFNGSITASKTSSGANFALNGEVASNGTSLAITDATAEIAYDENTTTGEPILNYFKFNGVTLQGIVAGYTIDGSITVNDYAQNAGLSELGGIEEIAETYFGGQVTCDNGLNTPYATALVQITLDGQIYSVYTDANGYFNTLTEGAYTFNDLESILMTDVSFDSNICPNGSTPSAYVGYAFIDTYEDIANSGWLPNDITFAGAISRTGASIEGTLNAKWLNAATMDLESDREIPFVDVTLNGKLQMPESPEMLMTLSYENNATHNTLGASYTYETTVINAEGVFDADMLNGDVAITTHTGIRADLKVTDATIVYEGESTVTKDGLLIGTFEDREGLPVVKYTDGSFESIF